MPGQCTDQVIALKVQGHQVNRRGHHSDRALHGGLLARDIDREVDLEHRNVGSAHEAVPPGVHARTENDDGVDVPKRLVELVIDVAFAARNKGPRAGHGPLTGRYRHAAQERPPHRANNRALAGRQDRQSEVVLDQAAFGRFVLLDGRLHHRAEGGLGSGIARHQRLFTRPASTGSVTPVT